MTSHPAHAFSVSAWVVAAIPTAAGVVSALWSNGAPGQRDALVGGVVAGRRSGRTLKNSTGK
jgi:hypothetical protein